MSRVCRWVRRPSYLVVALCFLVEPQSIEYVCVQLFVVPYVRSIVSAYELRWQRIVVFFHFSRLMSTVTAEACYKISHLLVVVFVFASALFLD